MEYKGTNLRLVTIEYPYFNWRNPMTRTLFAEMAQLKFDGYKAVHQTSILPVDSTDFIGAHHMVCREDSGQLYPLMAFKYVTSDRCEAHNHPFPAFSVLGNSPETAPHRLALQTMLNKAKRFRRIAAYGSSWTVYPEAREDKNLARLLRELFCVMLVGQHDEYGVSLEFCCGVPSIGTDLYFSSLGYNAAKSNEGQELGCFRQASLFGKQARLLVTDHFSARVRNAAKQFEAEWRNRIVIKKNTVADVARKAA